MSGPSSSDESSITEPTDGGSRKANLDPELQRPGDHRTGPKLDPQGIERLAGVDRARAEAPTWRGWLVGLISVTLLAWFTPHIEFYLAGSTITENLHTPGAIIALFLFLGIHSVIYRFSGKIALTRQDLTLITCMCMCSALIPGYGFMIYVVGVMAGPEFFAPNSGVWDTDFFPYVAEWLIPRDPARDAAGARPVEWLMSGLPPGESIPYGKWLLPYGMWALMAVCSFGMMFSVCSVLRRQWADRERLPFPLVQVPQEMIEGLPGSADRKKPFLQDGTALFGMAIPFLLHSWNSLHTYIHKWPEIPLKFRDLHSKYLTEPPWNAFGPLHIYIFPSVIGLTYLISLEVSFSLWFFYLVMKICAYLAVQLGLGKSHGDFYEVGGHKGFMVDQGGGALIAMVLFGLWMSRTHLARVFTQALGLRKEEGEEAEGLSSRGAFVLFSISFIGAVVWLSAAGVGVGYALLTVVCSVIILTGITRLVCEGGLFYVQSQISPSELLNVAFTPFGLGAHTVVPLGMWSRVFVYDWGRNNPMPIMMNALKLSSDMRVQKRPLALGIAVALLFGLSIGFFAFMHTAYTNPGGARALEGGNSWTMGSLPKSDCNRIAKKVGKIRHLNDKYDKNLGEIAIQYYDCKPERVEELREKATKDRAGGGTTRLNELLVEESVLAADQMSELLSKHEIVSKSELPDVALHDWKRVMWLFVGGILMVVFMILRTRIFWWPHPIGYVAWMHPSPMSKLWFAIFLGWLCKWAITQYGGFRVYFRLRRFFIGLVVGEIATAGLWIAVAWITDTKSAYCIQIN